jgi:hypothetical protein
LEIVKAKYFSLVNNTAYYGMYRCVVWTGDERVFFYNPSQNQSVWDCPEELEGRADVKKLMQTPPSLVQASAADGKLIVGITYAALQSS